jgi:hypothetical protein
MLCSIKMIFTSKFNAKLQKNFARAFQNFRKGGGDFFSGGGYQHPMAMYAPSSI